MSWWVADLLPLDELPLARSDLRGGRRSLKHTEDVPQNRVSLRAPRAKPYVRVQAARGLRGPCLLCQQAPAAILIRSQPAMTRSKRTYLYYRC